MKRVAIATLGCKTNQFESAAMAEQFSNNGYTIVPFTAVADIYVVNSCSVTARTDSETRRLIRRARRLNPTARIVATGCYAQVAPEELENMPELDTVLGNLEKSDMLHLAEEGKNLVSHIEEETEQRPLKLESFSEHTRAFLQVQNGCNSFCSYCIVPYSRGRSRSVQPEEVMDGIRSLAANGYKEVVLTGIHLGGYGLELPKITSLTELIREIDKLKLIPRLRIGSLEPNEVSEELLDLFLQSSCICHHFHLPLQSGSNIILKQMGRHYSKEKFCNLVEKIHGAMPDAFIGADVIAGFPGETESEFDETVALIESLPLSDLHVFPYSPRKGTKAATMEGQLPSHVITNRAKTLRNIAAAKKQKFLTDQIGTIQQVLVQKCDQYGKCQGISRNYNSVEFQGNGGLINTEQTVVCHKLESDTLIAT